MRRLKIAAKTHQIETRPQGRAPSPEQIEMRGRIDDWSTYSAFPGVQSPKPCSRAARRDATEAPPREHFVEGSRRSAPRLLVTDCLSLNHLMSVSLAPRRPVGIAVPLVPHGQVEGLWGWL